MYSYLLLWRIYEKGVVGVQWIAEAVPMSSHNIYMFFFFYEIRENSDTFWKKKAS